jgi:hypothetical protein
MKTFSEFLEESTFSVGDKVHRLHSGSSDGKIRVHPGHVHGEVIKAGSGTAHVRWANDGKVTEHRQKDGVRSDTSFVGPAAKADWTLSHSNKGLK